MNGSVEKDGLRMRRKLLCVATVAIAALLATGTPAGASTMQEIYGGVNIEGLETAQEYVAGDTVFPTYSLVNRSGAPLVVPPNTDFGTTFHLVGVLQHWIERLGPVQTIPSMPPQVFFDGSRYAAGGTVVAVDGLLPGNVLAPDLAIPYSWLIDTTGFPTGDYRFFVEYKQLFNDGGAVIQTATVDFHVIGSAPIDTTPPTLGVPSDITVDATAPDGAQVFWDVTATDDVDPNSTVACDPSSGSRFPFGTLTVICTATDASGNQTTAFFTVHVKDAHEQLLDLLQFVDSPKLGLGTSLHDKLVDVLQLLSAGDVVDGCGTLNAFVNSVDAQTRKSLTPLQAAELAADAMRIENVISC